MYVNYHNESFNPHRHFAFLRHLDGDATLFIMVNFDNNEALMDVNIPDHALDVLGLKEGNYKMTELLSGNKAMMTVSPTVPFKVAVPSKGAVIWKLDHHGVKTAARQ